LKDREVQAEEAHLKGVQEKMKVYRITTKRPVLASQA
jgi:hypothetical protein